MKNIDCLNSKNQGKLLRVFEEKKYRRVGGASFKKIDFRLICSSIFSLEYMVKEKLLRNDLIKCLNFYDIYVPSLFERIDDKDDLISEFINEIVNKKKISEKKISKDFLTFIMDIKFLKSTSQLKKFLEWSLSILYDNNDKLITKESIVRLMLNFIGDTSLLNDSEVLDHNIKNAREVFEKKYLEHNLNKFKKNISKMSLEIGMERTALYRKLKSLNIKMD